MQSKGSTNKHKEITSIDEAYALLYAKDQNLPKLIPSLSQVCFFFFLDF
jgi:hypothetical protein